MLMMFPVGLGTPRSFANWDRDTEVVPNSDMVVPVAEVITLDVTTLRKPPIVGTWNLATCVTHREVIAERATHRSPSIAEPVGSCLGKSATVYNLAR